MQKRWVASTSDAYTNRRCRLCLVPMSFLVSCAGFVPVLHCSGRSAGYLRGGVVRIALLPCVPIARSNEWIRSLMLVSVPVDMLIVWYPVRAMPVR